MLISAPGAAGRLVALVHTQAAGDNGPIDDMIVHLRALAKADHFPTRTIYASDLLRARVTALEKIGFGRTGVSGKWQDAFGTVTVLPAFFSFKRSASSMW